MRRPPRIRKREQLTAKEWLRLTHRHDVLSKILLFEYLWRAAGKRTRRDWWDVLAFGVTIEGYRFPIFSFAVRRQERLARAAA